MSASPQHGARRAAAVSSITDGQPMRFRLRHRTTYRYATPIRLGRHRLMLRPRDSHELKLYGATLAITPQPSRVLWQYDVFGNSVALADFDGSTTELMIDSELDVERFPFLSVEYLLSEHARNLPMAYSADEIRDLAGLQERHVPDPEHDVDLWAKGYLATPETLPVLQAMAAGIKDDFAYVPRDAYGTQSPLETLRTKSGTCRDFAYLMMEGARSLGLAARFVSGYVYDAQQDPQGGDHDSAGATHAWVQVYLPGAGWTHFDPTNTLRSEAELIPVAIVREPTQASPVSGTWEGRPGDALSMDVSVTITNRT